MGTHARRWFPVRGARPAGRYRIRLSSHLERHQEEQAVEREKARDLWNDEGWIFADELGQKLNSRTDQVHWKCLLGDAGVRDARLHDARHTAATVLLELGVNDPPWE
jgi:integrase